MATDPFRPMREGPRLYVVLPLVMMAAAAASALYVLFLARPFINSLNAQLAERAAAWLFFGTAAAGGLGALGGLVIGLRVAGRIRGIAQRAEALTARVDGGAAPPAPKDEIGALDAAVGRLTLSMDRFVRDSDILSRLPEGMLLLGPAGDLLSFNTTAEVVLETSLERFRGTPLLSAQGLFPLADGNEQLARLLDDALLEERSLQLGEVSVVPATGREFLLEVTVQHREWRRDSTALILLFRDASEKRRIREEIRRADQLAFLGGMAARVAHEIRTPMATVRGLVELLQADLSEQDTTRRQYIDRVLQAVDRQDRLVEDMLTLSHPEPESLQPVNLRDLIDDVVRELPQDARLRVSGAPAASLATIPGDAFRLHEVFTNLIKNALEASPPSATVEARVESTDRGVVRVVVHNTGVGIPAEIRERIFQPFFTTKAKGTGLGLAIAKHIVDAHRGTLRVDSDGQTETTFTVELPTTQPTAAAAVVKSSHG
ncbi:MAG TPA: ATP-binding protein [Methylomirabilota bacterium]|nr:ATP-binding protein [Methylomirabilota bacterium]